MMADSTAHQIEAVHLDKTTRRYSQLRQETGVIAPEKFPQPIHIDQLTLTQHRGNYYGLSQDGGANRFLVHHRDLASFTDTLQQANIDYPDSVAQFVADLRSTQLQWSTPTKKLSLRQPDTITMRLFAVPDNGTFLGFHCLQAAITAVPHWQHTEEIYFGARHSIVQAVIDDLERLQQGISWPQLPDIKRVVNLPQQTTTLADALFKQR